MGEFFSFHASNRRAPSGICAEIENRAAHESRSKLMTLCIPMPVLPEVQMVAMQFRIAERTCEVDERNSTSAKNSREREVGIGEGITSDISTQLHLIGYEHREQLRVKLVSITLKIADRCRSRISFLSSDGRSRESERVSRRRSMPCAIRFVDGASRKAVDVRMIEQPSSDRRMPPCRRRCESAVGKTRSR